MNYQLKRAFAHLFGISAGKIQATASQESFQEVVFVLSIGPDETERLQARVKSLNN